MKFPNFMVIIKIFQFYPDRCVITPIPNYDKTYFPAVFVLEDGVIGDCLYAMDDIDVTTEKEAVRYMSECINSHKPMITAMSN